MNPQAQPLLPPRFGWLEILLSSFAILALAAIFFLLELMVASALGTLVFGFAAVQPAIEALGDPVLRKSSVNAQIVIQLIGFMFCAAIAMAIASICGMQMRMSTGNKDPRAARAMLAQRIAFVDWRLDRQFWLLLGGIFAFAFVSGYVIDQLRPDFKTLSTLPSAPLPLFMAFLVIVGLGPICEEMFFRGWVYTAVRTRWGFVPTLLLTSSLFAIAHYESTLLYAVEIFPVGLALGFVRERYGSIKASAAFHGIYNLLAFVSILLGIG